MDHDRVFLGDRDFLVFGAYDAQERPGYGEGFRIYMNHNSVPGGFVWDLFPYENFDPRIGPSWSYFLEPFQLRGTSVEAYLSLTFKGLSHGEEDAASCTQEIIGHRPYLRPGPRAPVELGPAELWGAPWMPEPDGNPE